MTASFPPLPRRVVQKMQGYVPGEQPMEPDIVKLNTNEFPYPPDPQVLKAIRTAATDDIRLYPNPTSQALRQALARACGFAEENILVGNGSDENLRLLVQSFIAPGETIAIVEPTYSLYPVLAEMFEARLSIHPVDSYGRLPQSLYSNKPRMFMIANPNPPIGTLFRAEELGRLAEARPESMLVIDEAYVAFSGQDCLALVREYANVVVTRTFSKSHGMAGMRVGYVVAHPAIIESLDKLRDSYNINRVSQAAALAAVSAQAYYAEKCARIIRTRERLRREMMALNYEVPESHGNFIFARCGDGKAKMLELRKKGILVRYFDQPGLKDGVRITIGTEEETEKLISALM